MKTKLFLLFFLMAAMCLRAQTNNLTALLQQGLFEEQADRNLDAAISNYQSLATEFDQDRQIGATAIFRLGECYRMQGRTNEAAQEYERIINEFSDQATLVTLSRQDLAGMGVGMGAASPPHFQERLQAIINKAPQASNASISDEDQEIQRIQQMIQSSPDLINTPDGLGLTPLENAAVNGQLKVAAFLLDHGADINAGGVSPLDQAVKAGNRAMVEFLLNHGANINARENDLSENTPLHAAAAKGFQAVTEVLLANKADVNAQDHAGRTPLISAVQYGRLKIVQILITAGAKTDLQDNEGRTVLNYAIEMSPEIFQALLGAGTNPNTEDSSGRTPLSYAAEKDTSAVVKMLLDAKADPNGGTLDAPLLCAVHETNAASAELLLQAGAKPNAKGPVNWQIMEGNTTYLGQYTGNSRASITPLWLAIDTKQFPMVQLLLKYKADPNSTQVENQSLLFNALDNPDILAAMLDVGGKPDSLTPAGWPLLDRAVTQTNFVAVQLLLKHGANPNVSLNPPDNWVGYTPLHFAAQQLVDPKIVELLLDDHADPNIRGGDGKTPLDLLKDAVAQISSGTFHWSPAPASPSEQMAVAMELADLLRQHGALDNLPHWNSIKVSRPNANSSTLVFQKETNDWNRFTLLETVLDYYEYASSATSWNMYNQWTQYPINPDIPFPDLSRVTILRPSHESTNFTRIHVNLLNDTNGIDCSKDLPMEFGDTVEIPEREHTLAESDTNGPLWIIQISSCLQGRSGTVKLVVDGSQTIQIPLAQFGPLDCDVEQVLGSSQAQNVLTSDSDLSRVKVVRRDPQTGKSREWTPNGAAQQPENQPSQLSFQDRLRSIINHSPNTPRDLSSLWLRDGDVIEVPVKQ